ncbi:MAG: acetate uptake transporter [Vulcanimicrobiaceae bacterium]
MATLTNFQAQPGVAAPSAATPTVADPAPLGLAAFALTTFVLSTVNAGLVPKGVEPVVFGVAAAYGGITQLCAGMWEFQRKNTFGATAFSSYGAFWLSFALLVTLYIGKIPPENTATAVGLFLLAWSIFTTYMTIEARKHAMPVFVTFCLLTPTFYLLAFGALFGVPFLSLLGGYLGLATAFAAWYASYAGLSKAS